jgi:hypothetical protein
MSSPSPVCNSESDFEGHAAIDSAFVGDSTQQFCASIAANGDVKPDSAAVTKTYQAENFVNYVFEVQWVDGCDSDDSQSPTITADGGWSCEGLLKETYFGCNNGGVGGYIDDRCLRYSFTGGVGDETPPPGGQSPDESPADSKSMNQKDLKTMTETMLQTRKMSPRILLTMIMRRKWMMTMTVTRRRKTIKI